MSGREKFKENLLKMFPDETIAIEKFVNLLNVRMKILKKLAFEKRKFFRKLEAQRLD